MQKGILTIAFLVMFCAVASAGAKIGSIRFGPRLCFVNIKSIEAAPALGIQLDLNYPLTKSYHLFSSADYSWIIGEKNTGYLRYSNGENTQYIPYTKENYTLLNFHIGVKYYFSNSKNYVFGGIGLSYLKSDTLDDPSDGFTVHTSAFGDAVFGKIVGIGRRLSLSERWVMDMSLIFHMREGLMLTDQGYVGFQVDFGLLSGSSHDE